LGYEVTCRPGILVLGLGNSILRDDGVGVHAVRRFQQLSPRPCLAAEVGTAVFDAVHLIEQAGRIIAFDAVEAGGQPGSVYMLRAEDVRHEARRVSMHEIGLIQILRTLPRPPSEVVVIGAEPEIIHWGMELSPALESAVPAMVSAAQKLITYWQDGDRCRDLLDHPTVYFSQGAERRDPGNCSRSATRCARVPLTQDRLSAEGRIGNRRPASTQAHTSSAAFRGGRFRIISTSG